VIRRGRESSMTLNRELGHQAMIAAELSDKAWVEIACRRLDEAEQLLR
jgi:hypothetical protein